MSALVPMRWLDYARSCWWYLSGEYLQDYEADWLLWEKTGFPAFWPTGDAQGDCARQIAQWYAESHP